MAARLHALAVWRRRGGGRDCSRHCRWTPVTGAAWRRVRRGGQARPLAGAARRQSIHGWLWFNRYFNTARRLLGSQYWSLSAYLKHRVKKARQYIGSFADAVAAEAQRRGVDDVICGHIHHAEIRDINGVLYGNDGDRVESCTALVEHYDGRIELIDWIEH